MKELLLAVSFILAAFGQPAWVPFFGTLASLFGYALFFFILSGKHSRKQRFLYGTLWFSLVQIVQLSWLTSHPYSYIYAVLIILSLGVGAQFGLISALFNPKKADRLPHLLFLSGCWTIMEWSRLFLLSGYSWNPIGLALSGNLLTLQIASVVGVFGLSFLVLLTNLLLLRAWKMKFAARPLALWLSIAALPFLFGSYQLLYHSDSFQNAPSLSALLVQTAFPVEETMHFKDHAHLVTHITGEWDKILEITKKHQNTRIDLLVLPEIVVPLGTYSFVYQHELVENLFKKHFGAEVVTFLPPLSLPLAYQGKVNNAYWMQTLSNIFNANAIAGLEDAEDVCGEREYYSSAVYFKPQQEPFTAERYAKRVLLPMGEYIPFTFCKNLAAKYGVFGSFTGGREAKVWDCNGFKIGPSICYEETFGDLMRENKQQGANVLVNITNDAWYPHSRLVRQHLEHSRLRTVENGIPLLRSCNTGITCALDAFGRDVAMLGDSDIEREDLSDSLHATLPVYHYPTLYSLWGDAFIIGLSLLSICYYAFSRKD